MAEGALSASSQPGPITIFLRLTRFQFIPLIILPALVGTTLAWESAREFNAWFFLLVISGVALLHLGANAIDDCYDFQNGVDKAANAMFPKDFGGWKPLPRGMLSLRDAKSVSYLLFLASLFFSIYFFFAVGPWSLILGISGILLAIAYTAPPLKLDYRGLGLGEISIFLAFGPIPVLGAYYVQTGMLSVTSLLASVPVGLLTVTILVDHDLIFYEVYSVSKKYSLGTVLGRDRSLRTSLVLTCLSYGLVLAFAATKVLPPLSCIAPIAGSAILARKARTFKEPNEPPPHYLPFTVNGLLANWVFTLVLAVTILL